MDELRTIKTTKRVGDLKMDWQDLGKQIAKIGAPLLGGAVGGPAGAVLGTIISSALGGGNPDDPDDLARMIAADPEAALKLRQAELDNKVHLEEIAFQRYKAGLDTERDLRAGDVEVQVAETESEDEYVRRTRPLLLRRMFWLLCGLAVMQHPVIQAIIIKLLKVDFSKVSGDLGDQALAYVAYLFGVSFVGYAAVRSVFDKQGLSHPGGVVGKVVNLFGGK